jgi:DNA-binding FrmR family transcriptional regulator
LVEKRVLAIVSQLEALEKELDQAGQQLLEEYTRKLTAIIKEARQV